MLTKINRPNAFAEFPVLPWLSYNSVTDEYTYFYPSVYKSHTLTLPSKTFKGHATQLGVQLVRLAKQLGWGRLVFLGDTETPWLYQQNDYKPVQEALQYLIDNKIGKRFSGALCVDTNDLAIFIRNISWLSRCNASLPCFHFTNLEQGIIGHICKYGNLHIDTLSEISDTHLEAAFENTDFIDLADQKCYNAFGKTSAIAGRQIKL